MSAISDTGIKTLFLQIAEGDEAAFGQLFRLYGPKLHSYISKMTGSVATAEELVQNTFIRVWVSRGQLDEIENPNAWVYKLASNEVYNFLRHKKVENRFREHVLHTASDSHEAEDVYFHDMKSAIAEAIHSLPDRRRHIYQLFREHRLSQKEIAEQLGLSISTVKNMLKLAHDDIRGFLEKRGFLMLAMLFFFKGD